MRFNPHSELIGRHAVLSASKYHWINYSDEKMVATYHTLLAAQRGTELHDFASNAIRLRQKLRGNTTTMAAYVNDAIDFKMTPEQILFYSAVAFGTCDAISFRQNMLRIHDLKTGTSRTSMHQLEVYVALFCLEYGVRPGEILIELRIYQENEVQVYIPDVDDIAKIMDKIKRFDKMIQRIREEELG